MIKNTLHIQRIDAGLSTRARSATGSSFTADVLVPAGVNPACGSVESVEFAIADHMVNDTTGLGHANPSWLGGFVGNDCAIPAYGTKRTITGSLIEGMT